MTKFVAILNLTPDSFSDGGKFNKKDTSLVHLKQLLNSGADMIDVGAESTRPGAGPIMANEEWERLKDILPSIIDEVRKFKEMSGKNIEVALDSYHPENFKKALEIGIDVINDVSGFKSVGMQEVARMSQKKLILMHNLGVPSNPDVTIDRNLDIITELIKWAKERVEILTKIGIKKESIIFDPGIGFGKNYQQNIDIITDKATNKIIKEFNYLNYNSVYDWLDTYNQSLKNEKITFESYKNIKDLSVLEIGPGIGFNSLIYESFTSKDIYFYDFKEFLDIQKKILKNFDNLLNKVNFFSDIDLLKDKLKDKDYFVTSYWAFSEFNMEDRKMFYKVIENAAFSLFLSNPNFEDVSNHVFFNDLSKKINKKLLVIPFEKNNQQIFTKAHNYYILY